MKKRMRRRSYGGQVVSDACKLRSALSVIEPGLAANHSVFSTSIQAFPIQYLRLFKKYDFHKIK